MRVDLLIGKTITGLRNAGYTENTLGSYRSVFKGLQMYMHEKGVETYTPEVGAAYLPIIQERYVHTDGKRKCSCVITHLNNCLNGGFYNIPRKKRPPKTIEAFPEFEQYLAWCESKDLSRGTIRNYRDIASFITKELCRLGVKEVELLSASVIVGFCKGLSAFEAGHRHNVLFVLRNSLQYFNDTGLLYQDFSNAIPFDRYDHSAKLPSIYTSDEIQRMIKATGNSTPLEKRNFAMLVLTAKTGLRSSDVVSLTFDEIDWVNDRIGIMQKKTGATLYMGLTPEIGEAISDYILNGRPTSSSNTVFVIHTSPFSPMGNSTFNNIVEKALEKAGIDISRRKHGPHALRHSLASEMLSQGKSIKTIADQLGHQSIRTTTIYAKVDTSNLSRCALEVPAYREIPSFDIDDRLEIPIVGCLARHAVDYVLFKRAMGQKAQNEVKQLSNLARFSLTYDLSRTLLPEEMIEAWIKRRENEKNVSLQARISIIIGFANYLRNLGEDVFVPERSRTIVRKTFKPHIFSDEELQQFFTVVDSLDIGPTSIFRETPFYLSTLFRVLCGCGLRISEALHLRIEDVDLTAGTLYIRESKNDKDRIVVMSPTLVNSMNRYLDENLRPKNSLVFGKTDGSEVGTEIIYQWFRKTLEKAGIPHKGRDYGPRLHDFRHTFAMRSLNQMLSEGKALYAALPILKDYLGHSDIKATEQYLHLAEWMFPDLISSMNTVSDRIIPLMEVQK